MQIRKDFILREIADEYILVPIGTTALDFNGLITVNEIGALIWRMLQEESSIDKIVEAILDEYEIDAKTAEKDVIEFVDYLKQNKIIDEE